jgi:FeS assembly SUF system protein
MSEAAANMEIDMQEAEPPSTVAPRDHALWPSISKALRSVYDPEIPVNIYELGLIYDVAIDENARVKITMSLTAPGCPVAGEMPGQVQDAVKQVEGVSDAAVELVWDPAWNPSLMAETAKLQLNMF